MYFGGLDRAALSLIMAEEKRVMAQKPLISWSYDNFIYDEERGFIFAYVPKVACTNWKSLLRYMNGADNWLNSGLAHDKRNSGLRYLNKDNAEDAALIASPDIRKYAMVRDPFSRVLSAYLNKVEKHLPLTSLEKTDDHFRNLTIAIDEYRQTQLDTQTYPEVSFEVFLLWMQNAVGIRDGNGHLRADEHWAPQVLLLRDPDVSFDTIGRFENMTEDSRRILDAMGCDKGFPTQDDVKFAPTKATEKLLKYYTPLSEQLVREIYAKDFAAYGYPQELPSKA
jgi:hypothetical protein